jgi:PAS domain-containing protein
MFTQDAQGNIDSGNISAERILGYMDNEAPGHPYSAFTPKN